MRHPTNARSPGFFWQTLSRNDASDMYHAANCCTCNGSLGVTGACFLWIAACTCSNRSAARLAALLAVTSVLYHTVSLHGRRMRVVDASLCLTLYAYCTLFSVKTLDPWRLLACLVVAGLQLHPWCRITSCGPMQMRYHCLTQAVTAFTLAMS